LEDLGRDAEGGGGIVRDLLQCAGVSQDVIAPAVQLDALVSLRGLAQQYRSCIEPFWREIFDLARRASANDPNDLWDERAAQQAVLLAGDALRGDALVKPSTAVCASQRLNESPSATPAHGIGEIGEAWRQAATVCFAQCLHHSYPLLRAAGFACISSLGATNRSCGHYPLIPVETQRSLLQDTCAAVVEDSASPVRSAAAKALAGFLNPKGECPFPNY